MAYAFISLYLNEFVHVEMYNWHTNIFRHRVEGVVVPQVKFVHIVEYEVLFGDKTKGKC